MTDDVRRDHGGGIAGVDAGLLDVLHHAGDDDVLTVGDRVDVELDGVFEEPVDQDGMAGRRFHGVADVLAQVSS